MRQNHITPADYVLTGFQISKIAVIVGKNVCLQLDALIKIMPVWAPRLPHYELAAKRIIELNPEVSLTLFNTGNSLSPESEFLSLLSTIDLHHGEFSSTPWKELQVYGAAATEEISEALREYEVDQITPTAFGFSATRVVRQTSRE